MPDDTLKKSVTENDAGHVMGGGVIQMVVPFYPGSSANLLIPPAPPPYWSFQRDAIMRATVMQEPMWAAAIYIAITKMAASAWEITSDIPLRARRFHELFLQSGGPRCGWVNFIMKQTRDYFTCDNGAHYEIVSERKSPASKIVSLRHLDSLRCIRTGDPDIPVVYRDRKGKLHELRDYQVVSFSDMPDPSDTYFGVGLSAASRAYSSIYKLAAMEWYLREKIAGLHPLAIYLVNGVTTKQVEDATKIAEMDKIAKGVAQYMGAVIVGIPGEQAPGLVTIPLAELPERFNRKEEFDLAVLSYADNIGLDVQELQPLSGQGLGTGAQSKVLADKANAKGLAAFKQAWIHAANNYVLPELTTWLFIEKDYRDMQAAADVSKARAEAAKIRSEVGITTPEQELQVLVDFDELPKEFLPVDATDSTSLSDTEKPEDGKREEPENTEEEEKPEEEEETKEKKPSKKGVEDAAEIVEEERAKAGRFVKRLRKAMSND